MTGDDAFVLESLLVDCPSALAIVKVTLAEWPEHAKFLVKSFQQRTPEMLDATEAAAAAVRKLMAGEDRRFADDYHWTCDQLREEELFFHREGRYRLSTFAQAVAEVYSDADYMRRYMSGLLGYASPLVQPYCYARNVSSACARRGRGALRLPRGRPRPRPDDLLRRCRSSIAHPGSLGHQRRIVEGNALRAGSARRDETCIAGRNGYPAGALRHGRGSTSS